MQKGRGFEKHVPVVNGMGRDGGRIFDSPNKEEPLGDPAVDFVGSFGVAHTADLVIR